MDTLRTPPVVSLFFGLALFSSLLSTQRLFASSAAVPRRLVFDASAYRFPESQAARRRFLKGDTECPDDGGACVVCHLVDKCKSTYTQVECASEGGDWCGPLDCVGGWGSFSDCSASCGGGQHSRTYAVTRAASNGGAACSFNSGAVQTKSCATGSCPTTTTTTATTTIATTTSSSSATTTTTATVAPTTTTAAFATTTTRVATTAVPATTTRTITTTTTTAAAGTVPPVPPAATDTTRVQRTSTPERTLGPVSSFAQTRVPSTTPESPRTTLSTGPSTTRLATPSELSSQTVAGVPIADTSLSVVTTSLLPQEVSASTVEGTAIELPLCRILFGDYCLSVFNEEGYDLSACWELIPEGYFCRGALSDNVAGYFPPAAPTVGTRGRVLASGVSFYIGGDSGGNQITTIESSEMAGTLPMALGSLSLGLTRISLPSKELIGSIPASIGSLTDVGKLSLGSTGMTGTMPPSIGSMAALRHLDLSKTQFSGTLPSSFGSLHQLTYLELGTFSGALPVGFASLSKLALLDLSGSDISDVPDAWCSPESSPMWSELLRICHFPTSQSFKQNLCRHGQACIDRAYGIGCLADAVVCSDVLNTAEPNDDAGGDGADVIDGGLVAVSVIIVVLVILATIIVLVILRKRHTLKAQSRNAQIHLHGSKFDNLIKRLQGFDSIWVPPAMLEIVPEDRRESVVQARRSVSSQTAALAQGGAGSDSTVSGNDANATIIGAGASGRILLGRLKFRSRTPGHTQGSAGHSVDVLVALKQHYDVVGMNADANFAPQAESDFKSEVMILRRLRHPNVISFIGLYKPEEANSTSAPDQHWDLRRHTSAQGVYIVMEYAENGTVADHLTRSFSEVSLQLRSRWMIQVARAMDYLHLNKVIHRDLKPSNILLNGEMECLITDFGISCFANHTNHGTDGVQLRAPGTLEFMPPEAFLANEQGGAMSESSDTSSDDEQGTSAASAAERIEAKRRKALQRRLKRSMRKNRQQAAGAAESKRSKHKASVVAYDDSAAPLLDRAMPGRSRRATSSFNDLKSSDSRQLYKWDVYSYAMCVCSVFNRHMPFVDFDGHRSKLPGLVISGLRPTVPTSLSTAVQTLVQQMWAKDPSERPHFGTVLNQLMDEAVVSALFSHNHTFNLEI